jgi:hypothetical protein
VWVKLTVVGIDTNVTGVKTENIDDILMLNKVQNSERVSER